MHLDVSTQIFHLLFGKMLNAAWDFGKKLVQAVAQYCLLVWFVGFFLASYVSQPHPIAGRSAVRASAPF